MTASPITLVPKPKPPRPRRIRVKVIAQVEALPAALDAIRNIAADGDVSVIINVLGGEARS